MTMKITTDPCIVCGTTTTIEISEGEVSRYNEVLQGKPIDQVFHEWPADKRELFISGIHGECWDKIFGS